MGKKAIGRIDFKKGILMNNLRENKKYKKIISSPFTYLTGAVLLGILNIVHYITLQSGWSITGAFYLFTDGVNEATIGPTIRNIGLFFGALISAFACAEFKIIKIKSFKRVLAAVLGGLLMGYGAGIAGGCNVSAFFTAAASLSVSGWVFLIFLFAGAFIGIKLLSRFFID